MPNNAQMLKRRVDSSSSASSSTRAKDSKSSSTTTTNSRSEVLLFAVSQETVSSSTTSSQTSSPEAADTSSSAASSQSTVPASSTSTHIIDDSSDLSAIISSLENLSSSATPYFYLSNPSLNSVTATITDIDSVLAEVSKAHIFSYSSVSLPSSSTTSYSSVSVVTTLSYPSNSESDSGSITQPSQYSSMFYNSTLSDSLNNSNSTFSNSGDSYLFANDTQSNYSSIQTVTVKNIHTFTEGVVVTSTVVHGSSTLKITATIGPELTTIAFVYTQPYDIIQTKNGKESSFEFDYPTTVTTAVPTNYQLSGLSVDNFHTMTIGYDEYQSSFGNLKEVSSAKKRSGVIAGSVIGSVIGVLLLTFLVYFVIKKKNQKTNSSSEKEKNSHSGDSNSDTPWSMFSSRVASFFTLDNDLISFLGFASKSKTKKENANIFDDGYNYGQYDDLLSNRSGGASSMTPSLISSASSISESLSNSNADGSFDSSETNNNNVSSDLVGRESRRHRSHRGQHAQIPKFQNMRRKSGESNSSCDSSGSGGLFSMRESILKNAGVVNNSDKPASQQSPYVVYASENDGIKPDHSQFKNQYSMNGARDKVSENNVKHDEFFDAGPREISVPLPVATPQKNDYKIKKTENTLSSIYNGGGFLAGGRRRVIDTVYEESINSSAASNHEDIGSNHSSIDESMKMKNINMKNGKSSAYRRDSKRRIYNQQHNGDNTDTGSKSSNSGRRYSSSGLLKYYNNRRNDNDEEYESQENEEEESHVYSSENNFGYIENEDEEDDMEQIENPFETNFIEEDENEL